MHARIDHSRGSRLLVHLKPTQLIVGCVKFGHPHGGHKASIAVSYGQSECRVAYAMSKRLADEGRVPLIALFSGGIQIMFTARPAPTDVLAVASPALQMIGLTGLTNVCAASEVFVPPRMSAHDEFERLYKRDQHFIFVVLGPDHDLSSPLAIFPINELSREQQSLEW